MKICKFYFHKFFGLASIKTDITSNSFADDGGRKFLFSFLRRSKYWECKNRNRDRWISAVYTSQLPSPKQWLNHRWSVWSALGNPGLLTPWLEIVWRHWFLDKKKLILKKCFYVRAVFNAICADFLSSENRAAGFGKDLHASPHYDAHYEKLLEEDERRFVPGLGDRGVSVELQGEEAREASRVMKKEAFNLILSQKIPYNRTLNDVRHSE